MHYKNLGVYNPIYDFALATTMLLYCGDHFEVLCKLHNPMCSNAKTCLALLVAVKNVLKYFAGSNVVNLQQRVFHS